MTQLRLPDYIDHMLEATEQACSYVDGFQKEDFLEDKRTQQAVVLNLLLIGEISTKILNDHTDFADRHTSVPWRSMKGMRNRIAHSYYDINLETVWETVDTALPQLRAALQNIKASF
jgi:uncharacterized protein with HEPN domain